MDAFLNSTSQFILNCTYQGSLDVLIANRSLAVVWILKKKEKVMQICMFKIAFSQTYCIPWLRISHALAGHPWMGIACSGGRLSWNWIRRKSTRIWRVTLATAGPIILWIWHVRIDTRLWHESCKFESITSHAS